MKTFKLHLIRHGVTARLPQIVHRKGVGRVGEQDVGRFHRTQHGRGEHGVHPVSYTHLSHDSESCRALSRQETDSEGSDV